MTSGTIAFDAPVMQVADYIRAHCFGKARAKPYAVLAHEVGMDARRFRKEVERLRHEHHYPILSDCVRGYWWSDDERECREFRHAMVRRGISDIRTGKAMWAAEIDLGGQGHLLGTVSAAETAGS